MGWGCAQSLAREGAKIAFSVFSEREERDTQKLSATLPEGTASFIQLCDLNKDKDIQPLHQRAQEELGTLDFVIHAAAFSPKDGLTDHFLDVSVRVSQRRWKVRHTASWRSRRAQKSF